MLYSRTVPVTDQIGIVIPTVGEIIDRETEYYTIVSVLTAMPIDYMVQLDDIGVDFTQINEYELFLILFGSIRDLDTSLVFDGIRLPMFGIKRDDETGMPVLYDEEDDITIDRVVHTKIAETMRKIHHLEKNNKKPGNEDARRYMLERARKKAKRKKKEAVSQLEQQIVAMVNTEQFKYGFEGTRELSIYQFNESVRQIDHKMHYDNLMRGIYAGTIDPKSISQDELSWLIHK